ncbi:MAG: hypothetical protein Q9178_003372 [Gyalolechia marmorata]
MKTFHITSFAALATLQYAASAPVREDSQQIVFSDQSPTASNIRKNLKKAEVIPDVLDDFTPSFSLNITYPKSGFTVNLGNNIPPSAVSSSPDVATHKLNDNSAEVVSIHIHAINTYNNNNNDENTLPTPTLQDTNTTYTLALTDPDATSHANPTMAEMCHWILTGINTGNTSLDLKSALQADTFQFSKNELKSPQISTSNNNKPNELMSYYPPAPPPKTGYHRYIFVLLAPKTDPEAFGDLKKPKERSHWGYGKVGKGLRDWAEDNGLTPVGANFFYAKNKKQ